MCSQVYLVLPSFRSSPVKFGASPVKKFCVQSNVFDWNEESKRHKELRKQRANKKRMHVKFCTKWCLFVPDGKFKINWDLMIIFFTIWNVFLIPYQIAYQTEGHIIIVIIDRIVDFSFVMDIFINFRTMYFSSNQNQLVKSSKKIAKRYIYHGRFVIDLIASFPFDIILLIINQDSRYFGALRMVKLTRLFRLGRIITFLRTRKSITYTLRIGQVIFLLFICIHWFNCFWFTIISIDDNWYPPKDLDFKYTIMFNSSNYDEYVLTYYYATAFSIMTNESYPTNESQITAAIIILILGGTLLGVVIAQFSNLLEIMTSQQRKKNEDLDTLNSSMFNFRITESMQKKVLDFYDLLYESKYQYKECAFETLNHPTREMISLFQIHDTLKSISFLHKSNFELVRSLSEKMVIETFQAGDIIIKQDDIGTKFCLIIEGLAEVFLEYQDYDFYTPAVVKEHYDSNQAGVTKKSRKDVHKTEEIVELKMLTNRDASKNNKTCCNIPSSERLLDNRFDSLHSNRLRDTLPPEKKFSVINELKKGDYFGEISILTKYLTATATVRSIGNLVCGVIKKEDKDVINLLWKDMTKYHDRNFKLWHYLIKTVPKLENLTHETIREICLNFRKIKIFANTRIIRSLEISKYCYFILEGEVAVIVTNEVQEDSKSPKREMKHLFERLPKYSCFNFTNAYLGYYSLFEFRATTNCKLLQLSRDDMNEISMTFHDFQTALFEMKANLSFSGKKYDYCLPRTRTKKTKEGSSMNFDNEDFKLLNDEGLPGLKVEYVQDISATKKIHNGKMNPVRFSDGSLSSNWNLNLTRNMNSTNKRPNSNKRANNPFELMRESSEFSIGLEKMKTNVSTFKPRSISPLNPSSIKVSFKKIHEFFIEIIKTKPRELIKYLYEGWSIFCIIDIHFYQRMTQNIISLQNKEMRALNLSKNYKLPQVELKNQGYDGFVRQQKFMEIWQDLDTKFKQTSKRFSKYIKRTNQKYSDHVKSVLEASYHFDKSLFSRRYWKRVEFLQNTLKFGKIALRYEKKTISNLIALLTRSNTLKNKISRDQNLHKNEIHLERRDSTSFSEESSSKELTEEDIGTISYKECTSEVLTRKYWESEESECSSLSSVDISSLLRAYDNKMNLFYEEFDFCYGGT
ncbi:unnamed protein product [Moneuplotes crassus]|uniref:Cyclic nucleotide-binding domain-containing protein n=1 Tax=Euplotes crassus TaxID=5936 RepID=A0AAD1USU9_EUPCR|nr:unnamed protein product [Moneuplotes crassus]